jgi:hypothetical protein
MTDVPADLLAAIPADASDVARKWWATLSADDQSRVAQLWDERYEVEFFAPQPDDAGAVDRWEQVPAVHGGRFVPTDDDGRGEWAPGYFEYLLQHPELVVAYDPTLRTFHIGCTQHAAARKCLTDGEVPASFECPLGQIGCPLRPLRGASLTKLRA